MDETFIAFTSLLLDVCIFSLRRAVLEKITNIVKEILARRNFILSTILYTLYLCIK